MKKRPSQISETLTDLSVELGGLRMPLDTLCGGVLITGATGSGKTVSVINNLARQFATVTTGDARRKPAIFYFTVKGAPHRDFIESLPPARRKDVIHVTASDDCQWGLSLFPSANWPSQDAIESAVPQFVECLADHLSDGMGAIRHDPFWDRQRLRVLRELASLHPADGPHHKVAEADLATLHHPDALASLLHRLNAFLDHTAGGQRDSGPRYCDVVGRLRDAGFEGEAGLIEAENLAKQSAEIRPARWRSETHLKIGALLRMAGGMAKQARNSASATRKPTLLDRFGATLDTESCDRLRRLLVEYFAIPDTTRGCIATDLRGVVEAFAGPLGKLILSPGRQTITMDEVIQRGRILVIDLPLGDSGNATLPALIAIKLALFDRLLGRLSARCDGKPLCRRPVTVFIDEFHCLVSRGRLGGEDHFLARCREFGVTAVLATQSLSLLVGALRDVDKLHALVANCRTRVFGANTDAATNNLAAGFCGSGVGAPLERARIWHPSEALRRAVSDASGEERLLVEPHRFGELRTGQFYLGTPARGVYWVDLNFRLEKPILKILRHPVP